MTANVLERETRPKMPFALQDSFRRSFLQRCSTMTYLADRAAKRAGKEAGRSDDVGADRRIQYGEISLGGEVVMNSHDWDQGKSDCGSQQTRLVG